MIKIVRVIKGVREDLAFDLVTGLIVAIVVGLIFAWVLNFVIGLIGARKIIKKKNN